MNLGLGSKAFTENHLYYCYCSTQSVSFSRSQACSLDSKVSRRRGTSLLKTKMANELSNDGLSSTPSNGYDARRQPVATHVHYHVPVYCQRSLKTCAFVSVHCSCFVGPLNFDLTTSEDVSQKLPSRSFPLQPSIAPSLSLAHSFALTC